MRVSADMALRSRGVDRALIVEDPIVTGDGQGDGADPRVRVLEDLPQPGERLVGTDPWRSGPSPGRIDHPSSETAALKRSSSAGMSPAGW
jgi:hypothetical protein